MVWDPITSPCDYIKLAGKKSPGVATLFGAWRERELAIRQPPFSTGAVIIYKRLKLATFSARISLYTIEDHIEFTEWRKIIDAIPDNRKKATALDIWHPLLEPLDIKSVVISGVSQLEQIDDGEWAITISFQESRDLPKPTLAKVQGSKTGPSDPVDKIIDQNAATLKAMYQELAAP